MVLRKKQHHPIPHICHRQCLCTNIWPCGEFSERTHNLFILAGKFHILLQKYYISCGETLQITDMRYKSSNQKGLKLYIQQTLVKYVWIVLMFFVSFLLKLVHVVCIYTSCVPGNKPSSQLFSMKNPILSVGSIVCL